jgi:lysine 6-dehydrogenase
MTHRYAVLGAGRQGTAAAHDIARFGDAAELRLADRDVARAEAAAKRVNRQIGREVARATLVDVDEPAALKDFLKGLDVCLSAVPYRFNPAVARAAIEVGCSMCDLGGNADCVREQLAMDAKARERGVRVVPDCGVGPGTIAHLAVHAIEQFDRCDEVLIYDGGLPQNPRPPFNYALYFNIAGLTNEYVGDALYLKGGRLAPVAALDPHEYEVVEIPKLGRLEAFPTSGGLTTLAADCQGRLQTLKNKTLRHPGHFALFRGLIDLGLLDGEPVEIDGARIVPRELLHRLAEPRFAPRDGDRDLMVIHIRARGEKDGRAAALTVDMLDRFDEKTGFSAMERTTGFHAAIVAQAIARGEVPAGALPPERAVSAARMVEELARREIQVEVNDCSESV